MSNTTDEKNKSHTRPEGFVQGLVFDHLKENPNETAQKLRGRLKLSRSNYWRYMGPTEHGKPREISPRQWPKWRKALKLTPAKWWAAARDYFDPAA